MQPSDQRRSVGIGSLEDVEQLPRRAFTERGDTRCPASSMGSDVQIAQAARCAEDAREKHSDDGDRRNRDDQPEPRCLVAGEDVLV
jgi:hypothetical protein